MPKFEVYMSRDLQYRWRLKAGNGEIVATSEGYTTRQSATHACERVRVISGSASVVQIY